MFVLSARGRRKGVLAVAFGVCLVFGFCALPAYAVPAPSVQLQLRTDVPSTTATQFAATLTIINNTSTTIHAGTKLKFSIKGLIYDPKTSTLTGGATLKAKETATLDAPLAPGGPLTLTLHLALTKPVPGNLFVVKATLLKYSSNSISSATDDESTQYLGYKLPRKVTAKSVTTVTGAFFANNEPIRVTIVVNVPRAAGDANTIPTTIKASSKGAATLKIKGSPGFSYTVTLVGQWSDVTGAVSITI